MFKLDGVIATVAVSVLTCLCSPAQAQFIFLDTNGDGASTSADELQPRGTTSVDIWIQTDAGRNGGQTELRDSHGSKPTINSYTVILRAIDGEVKWGKYVNLQPSMTYFLGSKQNETDYFTGYGGSESLPAGKYKLGRLHFTIESGAPRIEIVSKSSLWSEARTSFGSACLGADGDNTLKLRGTGTAAEPVGRKGQGDWGDAAGVAVRSGSFALGPRKAGSNLRFDARVSRTSSGRGILILFRTTKEGFARVRLFDASGRLVKTLLDEQSVDAGEHFVSLGARSTGAGSLASGVYFYRVEATEGTRSGRVILSR